MTNTLQKKEHFKRIGNARIYLQEKGFVFMGAPDRWKLIGEDAISYAQIAQGPSDFVIIFSSLIRERMAAEWFHGGTSATAPRTPPPWPPRLLQIGVQLGVVIASARSSSNMVEHPTPRDRPPDTECPFSR
jgi:hypothetical protein